MFAAGALELERPFLGPLYNFNFMALHPRLRQLHSSLPRRPRHKNFAETLESSAEAPRVDAQASDARTRIGGWFPTRVETGATSVARSLWFSMEITEEESPWIFAKDRKAALVISTLEALAVLVDLKLQFGEVAGGARTRVRVAPTITDNRGNGAALNKLMTTKFPASALLMELSCYMKKTSVRAIEADRLANAVFDGFDPTLRIPVSTSERSRVGTFPECQAEWTVAR